VCNLGILHIDQGRTKDAVVYYGRARVIFREADNGRGEVAALTTLANLLVDLGRVDEAQFHFQRAPIIAKEIGIGRSEGIISAGMGRLRQGQGSLDKRSTWASGSLERRTPPGLSPRSCVTVLSLRSNAAIQVN
jgi:tetratricopeptide (TPR) repeat protein